MTQEEQGSPEKTRAASTPEALSFASGRYVVTRLLGEGGQKRVYLAQDTQLHRNVAIAFIKAEGLDDAALGRFRREAQTIARLGAPPNVIAIFDIGEEGERPYTVCEYAPGGDLRQKLQQAGGPLSIERAIAIARDLCQGLALAHGQGVLHRDIKPDNVWFMADGTAKLGDFGLAVAFGQSRLTALGTVLGTAAYMPPEQALGGEVTARSDLYSLGCLIYEMVCGRPPFRGDDSLGVVFQHINTAPVAPSEHREDIPKGLEALILRLMAKRPEERPESAVAVLESLSAIAAVPAGSTELATAVATPAPEVRHKAARPKRRPLVAGVALVAVAGAAAVATMVFALRDSGGGKEGAVIPATTLVTEGYVPKLEPRDCPAELKRAPDVRCQDLVVPEDRANPSGRQVRILVTFAPATAQATGVPLVSIASWALYNTAGESELRGYGDFVGIGVRGTQFSEPVLACPEVAGVQRQILGLQATDAAGNTSFLDAAERCGQRLASEGVNLSAYGDSDIADDVRDLAIAMGWRQINVEGHYDAAQPIDLLASRYPGLVRSVVLEEPNPPGVAGGLTTPDIIGYNAALQAYYAACRADAACQRAFPNLEQVLPVLSAQYSKEPTVVTTADPTGGADIRVMLDGDAQVYAVVAALGNQSALPIIASILTAPAHTGDAAVAAFLVENTNFDPAAAWGAWFSEFCGDGDQARSRAGVEGAAAVYPLFRQFAHDATLELCARWPTKPRAEANPPFEKALTAPALILTGALNPYSSPASAQRAANLFSDATVAVFPSLTSDVLGVGPNSGDGAPCVAALRLDFLRDPKAKLDIDGCIAKIPPLTFVGADSASSTPAVPTSSAP